MDKETLYKEHSYAACISEGFHFLAKQLHLIAKVLTPYFAIAALLQVISIAINIRLNVATLANLPVTLQEMLLAMLMFTLAYFAYIFAGARMFLMFRRLTGSELSTDNDDAKTKQTAAWKTTLKRTVQLTVRSLPYTIWFYLINLPGFPIIDTLTTWLGTLSREALVSVCCAMLLATIVAVLFITPLIYTFYHRMMALKEKISFKELYKRGWKKRGKTFGVTALGLFILVASTVILLLPGIISIEAYFSNVEGSVNFNDTTIIPHSGYAAMLIASTIAITIAHLFSVNFYTALLHVYGDAETMHNAQCIMHNS